MSGRYAKATDVAVARSRAEIEATIKKYGGERFSSVWLDDDTRAVCFRIKGDGVLFDLKMPSADDPGVGRTPTGQKRTGAQLAAAVEQEERRRWRVLLLRIKARLEEVAEHGIAVDEAFMANLVLPEGETMREKIGPVVAEALETSAPTMPRAIPSARVIALPEGRRA